MARTLEDVMSHAYAQLEEQQQLEAETSLLKTYLVEAHIPDPSHDTVHEALEGIFDARRMGERGNSEVVETDEPFFFNVIVQRRGEESTFYIDASDHRFWILHSIDKSTPTDTILRRVVGIDNRLDFAWLPMQLLESLTHLGSFRGLGLDYDRRQIPDVDFNLPNAPVEYLKMQLWGNRAADILRTLRDQAIFAGSTTLSKVKVKHWLDRQRDENLFSLDDVKYDGKITARGTSFQSHLGLVTTVYRSYAAKIQEFERHYAIGYTVRNGSRLKVDGEPLNIRFGQPIADLGIFVDSIFSASHPFRLWGVPTKVRHDYVRVAAVDLHVSQRVNFEITPNFMRIYLPQGSCGNTIARLYTNLQHYYDSLVRVYSGSAELNFEL